MGPAVVKTWHGAFKKAIDDSKHLELAARLNPDVGNLNSADYAEWARETYAKEMRPIDRLRLSLKWASG